jgi:MFS family permease
MPKTNKLQETLALIRQGEFGRFITLRFCLIFALYLQSTVISYHLYELTGSPLALGLLGLAEVIPAFLVSLPAGVFVDRNDKQKVFKWCIIAYTILALVFMSIIFYEEQLSISLVEKLLYVGTFIGGSIRSFVAPASFSLLPMLVAKEDYTKAISWSTTAWYLGSILGPLVGGALLIWCTVGQTLCIGFLFLIIALTAIWNIGAKPATPNATSKNAWQELQEGLKFVFSTELILACLGLDLFAVLFGGAESLLPVFSKDILHVGSLGFGVLRSAHGLGSILLTIILIYLPLQKAAGKKMLGSVALFGLCVIGLALSKNIYLSFVLLFIGGIADGVSVVIRHSVLQLNTPQEMKGRVASINSIFISSSNELGAFESGLAAKYMGTIPSVIFGGVMTLFVVALVAIKSNRLRDLDL